MGDQGASDRNRMRPLDGETGACLCDATVLVVEAGAELGWLSCWQPAMTATSRVPVASRRDRPSTIMWPSRSIPGGLSLDLVHLLGDRPSVTAGQPYRGSPVRVTRTHGAGRVLA